MTLNEFTLERLSHILPIASYDERKIGMSLSLRNLENYAKKYALPHCLTALVLSLYCGLIIGSIILIIMLLNSYGLKYILDDVKKEYDIGEIDVANAEKRLWIHPFSRSVISGIIYILFVSAGNQHSVATGAFFAGATIIILLNQTAGNFKLLLSGLMPILAFISADALNHLFVLQDSAAAVAPMAFVFIMLSIGVIIANDKINGAKLILANIEKNKALRESLKKIEDEKRSQDIVEKLAKVGKFNWYFQGKGESYWSAGAFDAFGFEQSDKPPKREDFVDRIPQSYVTDYFKTMEECRFSGKPYELQFSIKDMNGNLRHIITNGAPIFDENGTPIGMEGIVIDQTDLRNALSVAEENKKLLQMALMQGQSAVTLHKVDENFDGPLVGFGDLSNLGFEPHEYDGDLKETIMRYIDENEIIMIKAVLDKAIETNTPQHFDNKINLPDGNVKYLTSVISVEKNKDNDGMVIITINNDRTKEVLQNKELEQAYNEVKRSQNVLQLALTQGRSVVLLQDTKNEYTEGYGALEIFGITEAERNGNIFTIVPRNIKRDQLDKVMVTIKALQETGETQIVEHEIINLEGETTFVRAAFALEGNDVNDTGRIISITNDITKEVIHRKELSEALETANNASRVKSEFLANMSHEIRTPLNGVVAVAGLLANTELNNSQKEMVALIENSSKALNQILNDVLDLARVESGRLEISKIDFNLKESLNSITALFGVKADEKGLGFESDIPEEANTNFIGDPIRIRQILANYVSNAIKFTAIGKVSLITKISPCKRNKDCLEVRFDVCDTGNGIPKEALSRLFERFEQADGSITREHGGSGLGLAISKGLAELMGGRVEVKSKVGKGSVFSLIIPLQPSSQNNIAYTNEVVSEEINNTQNSFESEETEIVEDEGSLKILGVDDNVTNRKVLDMVLAPIGVDLRLCTNGLEAVEAYNAENFDAVLMDLQMPVMDGLSAIREIRKLEIKENRHHIPIIAVSANAMTHHVAEALEAGADYHVAKPFSPQTLIDAIEKALIDAENKDITMNNQAIN